MTPRTLIRTGKATILCLTVALLLPPIATGAQQPAPTCGISNFPAPTLCARARLDTVRATYVVVVDGSGSMAPIWPQVRQSLASFASAVPDGDVLDVQLFSSGIQELIAPVPANESSRADWGRTFSELRSPRGTHTDLGVAARAAVRQIQAAPPGRQVFVFLLTDGVHEAPANSPFRTLGSAAWAELESTASTLAQARAVDVSILRLTPQADLTVLRSVFNEAIVSNTVTAEQLHEWFTRKARAVAVDKLLLAIREELQRPAFDLVAENDVVLGTGVARRNSLYAVPNRSILTTTSTAAGPPASFDGGHSIRLDGTIAADTPVAAYAKSGRPWYLPPERGLDTAVVMIPVLSTFEPADELKRIGITPEAPSDSVRIHSAVRGASVRASAAYWSALAAVLALLVAIAVKLRWSMHRPALRGQLTIDRGRGDETVDLSARGGTRFHVADASGNNIMTLEARAHRGRTVYFAIPDSLPLMVSGRQAYAPERIFGAGALECGEVVVHYLLR